jgi:predicted nucleic acid-binding protein
MIIVCDSSALFALAICDKLDLLDKLYNTVLIPGAVFRESIIQGKPNAKKIKDWAQNKVVEVTKAQLLNAFNLLLDRGEAEAVTLYKEKSADLLLIDEIKGRKIARYYNVNIIGTLGILLKAKKDGVLSSIKPSIDLLQKSSIRISDDLYKLALDTAVE